MALNALLCSGNDASPQHGSVLKAIRTLNSPQIIPTCSVGLPLLSRDVGAEHRASYGALGVHLLRLWRPWWNMVGYFIVVLVVAILKGMGPPICYAGLPDHHHIHQIL
jgi:hypothetical protein